MSWYIAFCFAARFQNVWSGKEVVEGNVDDVVATVVGDFVEVEVDAVLSCESGIGDAVD